MQRYMLQRSSILSRTCYSCTLPSKASSVASNMVMMRSSSSPLLATLLLALAASYSMPPLNVRQILELYRYTASVLIALVNITDPMQLVDELSMIYTTCLMCYATFSYSKSRQFGLILAMSLVSLSIFITLYYHYLQDPAFHQNAYAILTATVVFRSIYVMEFNLRPSLTKREEEYKLLRKRSMTVDERDISRSDDRRDQKILKSMWWMIASGLSIFLGGFAIWNLDNEYCSTLRIWRREIGLPWGILLEGHGWW